jgi:hypothetical protein
MTNILLCVVLLCGPLRPMSNIYYRYRMLCMATGCMFTEFCKGGRECRAKYWRGDERGEIWGQFKDENLSLTLWRRTTHICVLPHS